jgi:GGDEF domain-containing protein
MKKKDIVIVSQRPAFSSLLEGTLQNDYHLMPFENILPALDHIYNAIPGLLIIDITGCGPFATDILNNLKGDPIFNQLPVLAVFDDAREIPRWDSLLVEDYILKGDVEREGLARVNLCVLRSERVVEVNPLTKLPGNISINRQIQQRIDRGDVFALAYGDLDNFKPFNDHYGFTRGDEVIKVAGRLILNIVKNKQPVDSFMGHIGGDDFIYIMDLGLVEEASAEIILAFDRIIPTFYDPEDGERGYIQTRDRQGNEKGFPVVSLSIGIAHNRYISFSHYGEFTEVASEMKKHAKLHRGSCYKIDKRQGSHST